MRFWDSSAVVPLCLTESTTPKLKKLLDIDKNVVAWWGTWVECMSAFARLFREGKLNPEQIQQARANLELLSSIWSEIQPEEIVRQRAGRLLMVHSLHAADSLQLAAALLWARDNPKGHEFVCLDANLNIAASKEGFAVFSRLSA